MGRSPRAASSRRWVHGSLPRERSTPPAPTPWCSRRPGRTRWPRSTGSRPCSEATDVTPLHAALLELGLEDWIPLPEMLDAPEVRPLVDEGSTWCNENLGG